MQRHFTATAFVVDARKRTLLLWHRRLERWMPPGGHVDPDELPEETARRECKEETGLDVEILGDGSTELTTGSSFDLFSHTPEEGRMLKRPHVMLLENIPASAERDEPAHQHMDFVFLARPLDDGQTLRLSEAEGRELKWFTREEVAALDESKDVYANVKAYALRILT